MMKISSLLPCCISALDDTTLNIANEKESEHDEEIFGAMRDNLIGAFHNYHTVFGQRLMVYADYTASGRSLRNIEDFMRNKVLPFYGNTHSSTCITGSQTTQFRNEARAQIARAMNAKIAQEYGEEAVDALVFCGSGVTAAINKLVYALGLDDKTQWEQYPKRPVVFVGIMEHHSNILPWRESVADVVVIPEHPETGVNLDHLRRELANHADRPLRIGSFSAASNITGIMTDTDAVAACLHAHGALACFDHASAAPYHQMNMNPQLKDQPRNNCPTVEWDTSKDAIFFSGHKFVGGPGTPGVLVVKRQLLRRQAAPQHPGGGTVLWVDPGGHRYLPAEGSEEEREEGGTPDILGAIRLGLVFQAMEQVGWDQIKRREEKLLQIAKTSFAANPNIRMLGQSEVKNRLPIFSFLIRAGNKYLHPHFVAALFNDLFGIQTRSGCACAGPYAMGLLEIQDLEAVRTASESRNKALKPGFTRLSFCYVAADAEVNYIIEAVHHIADWGYLYLSQYRLNPTEGTWEYCGVAASEHFLPNINSATSQSFCSNTEEETVISTDSSSGSSTQRSNKKTVMKSVPFHSLELFSEDYKFDDDQQQEASKKERNSDDKCWRTKTMPAILFQTLDDVYSQTDVLRKRARMQCLTVDDKEQEGSGHADYWFWTPQDFNCLNNALLLKKKQHPKANNKGRKSASTTSVQVLTKKLGFFHIFSISAAVRHTEKK